MLFRSEAVVGYGGPLLGTMATLFVMAAWFFLPRNTHLSHILLAGSWLGSLINLMNLVPVSPLDGGRITQAAGGWVKYIGISMLAIASVLWHQPAILYIWIIVLFEMKMFPPWFRAMMAACCWMAMVTLMSLGYGSQPVFINVLDCTVTAPFVGLSVASAIKKEEWITNANLPALSNSKRTLWLAAYVGLCIVLVATCVLQSHYLPKH